MQDSPFPVLFLSLLGGAELLFYCNFAAVNNVYALGQVNALGGFYAFVEQQYAVGRIDLDLLVTGTRDINTSALNLDGQLSAGCGIADRVDHVGLDDLNVAACQRERLDRR